MVAAGAAALVGHLPDLGRKLDFVTLHSLGWIPYAAVPPLGNASLIASASLPPNEKSEDENMGNKEGWHDGGWDEECGPQFSGINLNP
jgi:hypothetical protein